MKFKGKFEINYVSSSKLSIKSLEKGKTAIFKSNK